MKTTASYISFLHKIVLKKKSTFIVPIVWMAIAIILSIIFATLQLNDLKSNFAIYAIVFAELLITIFYASMKSLHIYKDLEEEGVELLTYSKPISRKSIFLGKFSIFIIFGAYWGLTMLLSNLFIGLGMHYSYLVAYTLLSFAVFFLGYIMFGMIASIIGYKLNGKIALAVPMVAFTPLVIGGSVIASQSTATSNNLAFYLNAPRNLQPAGNKADIEMFYLNNDQDSFYIMPNGYDANTFSSNQANYIKQAYNFSKASANEWQAYSWLIMPYQLVDIFNIENKNIFDSFASNVSSNLDNYIYYNHLDSPAYSYALKTEASMPKYQISLLDINKQPIKKDVYLVPGALKNQVNPDLTGLFTDTNIIYVRNGADNFNITFPEDSYSNTTGDTLVGKLEWKYLKELLNSRVFNAYGQKFVREILNDENYKEADANDYSLIAGLINNKLQAEIENENSMLNKLDDANVTVLNDEAITKKIIKSKTEKEVYLLSAMLYYIYFNYNNTNLVNAMLYNKNTSDYSPRSYEFQIGGYSYSIGGYASYSTKQEVKDNQVVIRYDLKKSNNYLFQPLDQMYQVSRDKQIINKYGFIGIWIALGFIFILINNVLYIRKDYR
ncbi:ABC transporter permease [Mycoplasma sp. SK341A]|uniref:ABC transporter permease n=1 Tax=unclassified Mycoplasma TaxID=2683645 RepID=UPI003AABCB4D